MDLEVPLSVHSYAGLQGHLLPLLRSIQKTKESLLLVLIGGCSRSGKTSLSERMVEDLKKNDIPALHIPLDHWLVDVRKRSLDSKVLDRFEYISIIKSVQKILHGETIYPPIYNPVTRERIAEVGEKPYALERGVIVVDGVIALAVKELRTLAQLKVYVEISDIIRLERLQMFYRSVKGLGNKGDSIIHIRELEEIPFIKNTRQWADLIVEFQ